MVEHQNERVEAGDIFPIVLDGLGSRRGAVRQTNRRPFVALHLRGRHGIDLAFCDGKYLAFGPQVAAEQRHAFGVTDDREPLVGGPDLLRHWPAGFVAEGCDLNRLAFVGCDAIAKLAAGLLA